MRERRPQDWATDLSGRHQLETVVARAIEANTELRLLGRNTDRFDQLDYTVATRRTGRVDVELKAKWQPYRGWHQHRPDTNQQDLFILDELALRKLVAAGPNTQLLIWDNPQQRWIIFGVPDLILAPKARVARKLNGRTPTTKGKVLIDLNDGYQTNRHLPTAVTQLAKRIDDTTQRWSRIEPWPTPTQAAS